MGLYDRDYYRDINSAGTLGLRSQSAITTLIVINVVVWVLQWFLYGIYREDVLTRPFGCSPQALFQQGAIWQLVTANFLHHVKNPFHILFNMLFLYFFGRELESIYGKRDFLIFYLLLFSGSNNERQFNGLWEIFRSTFPSVPHMVPLMVSIISESPSALISATVRPLTDLPVTDRSTALK